MPPIYTSQSHTQTIPRVLCLQFGKLLWEENINCITKSPGLVWQYSRLIWQKLIQSLKQHSHLHHALEELWQRPTSQILKHTRVESHYGGLLPLQLQTILSVQLEHCTWKVRKSNQLVKGDFANFYFLKFYCSYSAFQKEFWKKVHTPNQIKI